MKIIILLVLSIFFMAYTFGDDDLLSKFYQSGYKMKDIRTQVISYDKNYYEFFNLKTFKYNRTTAALNCSLMYKKDVVEDKVQVFIQAFKFASNEYRRFPIRFQVNLCKAFNANVGGALKMLSCGNVTNCHFIKGVTYHICNFVIDETHLPPLIPNGQYKIQLKLLDLDHSFVEIHFFGEIYIPIDYPKK